MTAGIVAGAPFGNQGPGLGISWDQCHREVKRLQARIVKAVGEGCWNKVKALQWLLTHSFAGKSLAVKRVTENKGKNTPGVDKVTWKNPQAKIAAIESLKRRGYAPLPLRRVLIPKKNGKTSQNHGYSVTQAAWLSTAAVATSLYSKEQRSITEATAWHSHYG